jgi:hypothetical protein
VNKVRGFFVGLILVAMMLSNAGCALIGAAAAAGMSYGIYQATQG